MTDTEREIVNKWADHLVWQSHVDGKQPMSAEKFAGLIWLVCEEYLMAHKVPQYDKELRAAYEENQALRKALSEVVESLGNGGKVSTQCSVDFLKHIPEEVKLVVHKLQLRLKQKDERLEKLEKEAVDAPRRLQSVKLEAQHYHADHMKAVNWLCDNEYGESCGNPTETVIKLLNLYRFKSNVQSSYIQALIEELEETVPIAAVHGWNSSRFEVGEKLRKELSLNDDKIEALKKCT